MMLSKEDAKKEVKRLIDLYEKYKASGDIKNFEGKEQNTKTTFILPLFKALGWDVHNEKNVEVVSEERVLKGAVDYAFRISGQNKFFVEAKPIGSILKDHTKQAIEYGVNSGNTWVVLTSFESIIIFNCEWKEKDWWKNALFGQLDYKDYLDNFDMLWLLSKESITNNKLDEYATRVGKKVPRTPIDKELLAKFLDWRLKLSKDISSKQKYSAEEIDELVQKLLIRLLFIKNCEDRDFETNYKLLPVIQAYKTHKKGVLKLLRRIFDYYDQTYDSSIFENGEVDTISFDESLLFEILDGLHSTSDGLRYNFNVIPSDVMGNLYEQYLGHILKKTPQRAKLKEGKAHRKEQGIYYTPTYIVDYIVRNTLGELLKGKKVDASKIRILDPACGSGSFLVKAFDVMNEHYTKDKMYGQKTLTGYSTKERILKDNIFGVDLDKQAAEIAQLNLLLKIAEKGQKLPLLEQNIRIGNSLIDDEKIDKKAFKWEEQFSEIMKDGGFDVVVGNPPYGADLREEDLVFLKGKLATTAIKNYDSYVFFIENAIKLLKEGGLFGFIVPDTFLRKSDMVILREVILNNFKVRSIAEVGAVFGDAKVTENVVFIFEKCSRKEERGKNKFLHRTLNKEESRQERLLSIAKNTWSSEGSIAQISWVESPEMRLGKFNEPKLLNIIGKIERGTLIGDVEDIEVSRGSEGGKDLVKDRAVNSTYKPIVIPDDITKYSVKFRNKYFPIKDNKCDKYQKEKLLLIRIRNTRLKDRIVVAYDNSGMYTLKTLQILNLKEGSKQNLKYILGILNSKVMNFYCHHYLSDDINKKYIGGLRIILKTGPETASDLIYLVDKMLYLYKQLNSLGDKLTDERAKLEEDIKKADSEIDELVYKIYGITEEERKVIEESLK